MPIRQTRPSVNDSVLALSWKIATQPLLYRALAENPYSSKAIQIGHEKFPGSNSADIIKAVILAEPEGRYDKNFKLLGIGEQAEELPKQQDISAGINERLVQYCQKYARELSLLPKELIYDSLCRVAFNTSNLSEVELRFAQNQRKSIKLLISSYVDINRIPIVFQPIDKISSENKLALEKNAIPKTQFVVAFAVISSIAFLYLGFVFLHNQSFATIKKIVQGKTQTSAFAQEKLPVDAQKEGNGVPLRLKIPSINVDAAVEHMGLTPEGTMDVPGNTINVGWYKLGSRPGEKGSAVISGHFDGRIGESGVFNNLNKLKQGDKIYVINDLGVITTFVVRESRTFSPGYADEVFLSNDEGKHLNLITCDGVWDGVKKSYSKRLVVFADIL